MSRLKCRIIPPLSEQLKFNYLIYTSAGTKFYIILDKVVFELVFGSCWGMCKSSFAMNYIIIVLYLRPNQPNLSPLLHIIFLKFFAFRPNAKAEVIFEENTKFRGPNTRLLGCTCTYSVLIFFSLQPNVHVVFMFVEHIFPGYIYLPAYIQIYRWTKIIILTYFCQIYSTNDIPGKVKMNFV